jgi:murein DD-endopeptidase MepM/ murein hydrolase activator NlpD
MIRLAQIGSLIILVISQISLIGQDFYWPTPHQAFSQGQDYSEFIQPTIIEKPYSGLFGCVRNNGTRFHEGIDIRPLDRDKNGEAVDSVYATMDGRIVHISKVAGNSSYGRYVVIEHEKAVPMVYSLYAHLSTIATDIKVGQWVEGGRILGIMGRSAGGYTIPKERAHLHFEIGFRLTDNFEPFYKRKKFQVRNQHGIWNGMNLVGMNSLEYFMMRRQRHVENLEDYIKTLPSAYVVRVLSTKTPDFVQRYPSLVELQTNNDRAIGWDIEFTWFGLPKHWRVVTGQGTLPPNSFRADLIHFEKDELAKSLCRRTLTKSGSEIGIGKSTKTFLELLFGTPVK